jgi:hypothetical protein
MWAKFIAEHAQAEEPDRQTANKDKFPSMVLPIAKLVHEPMASRMRVHILKSRRIFSNTQI